MAAGCFTAGWVCLLLSSIDGQGAGRAFANAAGDITVAGSFADAARGSTGLSPDAVSPDVAASRHAEPAAQPAGVSMSGSVGDTGAAVVVPVRHAEPSAAEATQQADGGGDDGGDGDASADADPKKPGRRPRSIVFRPRAPNAQGFHTVHIECMPNSGCTLFAELLCGQLLARGAAVACA
ncbi:hypothetical protein T492DRAFT_879869 [Pavlovales sp. CCMP2436]|nr:hypothetical protein T492DRAFT_879869 [Pavlovales sp. CCMP2436]